jgi:hypothetical protein
MLSLDKEKSFTVTLNKIKTYIGRLEGQAQVQPKPNSKDHNLSAS